nr:remorin-like isoform X2 [Ipomoea batatas]
MAEFTPNTTKLVVICLLSSSLKIPSIKSLHKHRNTIDEWETKKTKKAKCHLEETEADLDTRRAKALAHYRNEVERIVNISEGAKRQAEQNGYTNASV